MYVEISMNLSTKCEWHWWAKFCLLNFSWLGNLILSYWVELISEGECFILGSFLFFMLALFPLVFGTKRWKTHALSPSICLKCFCQLDQIILWLRLQQIIKSSSKNCYQGALYYKILPPDDTLVLNFARTTQYPSKETILTHYAHIWVGLAVKQAQMPDKFNFKDGLSTVCHNIYKTISIKERKLPTSFLPFFISGTQMQWV